MIKKQLIIESSLQIAKSVKPSPEAFPVKVTAFNSIVCLSTENDSIELQFSENELVAMLRLLEEVSKDEAAGKSE